MKTEKPTDLFDQFSLLSDAEKDGLVRLAAQHIPEILSLNNIPKLPLSEESKGFPEEWIALTTGVDVQIYRQLVAKGWLVSRVENDEYGEYTAYHFPDEVRAFLVTNWPKGN